jgi:hypothetical protein
LTYIASRTFVTIFLKTNNTVVRCALCIFSTEPFFSIYFRNEFAQVILAAKKGYEV